MAAMRGLLLIPWGVFALCIILNWWFVKRVRDALNERHPGTLPATEKSPFPFPTTKSRRWKLPIRLRELKQLNDPELDRRVLALMIVNVVAVTAMLVFLLMFFGLVASTHTTRHMHS
jgi:hypothetical protein